MSGELRRWLQKAGGEHGPSEARNLSSSEAQKVWDALVHDQADPVLIASFFSCLRSKGTSSDELVGFARGARSRLEFPELPDGAVVLGTSRLGKKTHPPLGLAAAAAAVASGTPVLIQSAPHAEEEGITLADVYDRLVGPVGSEAAAVGHDLAAHGLACWRPTSADPSWEVLLDVEDRIGLRCLPDIVCKLLAPPGSRVLVASRPGPVLALAGDTLAALGHQNAVVLQGLEGSIDPAVSSSTRGMELSESGKSPLRLEPEDFGLVCAGEPPQMHEDRLEAAVLAQEEALLNTEGPALACVLLCAALILRLGGRTRDLAGGVGMARQAIESGKAGSVLEGLKKD